MAFLLQSPSPSRAERSGVAKAGGSVGEIGESSGALIRLVSSWGYAFQPPMYNEDMKRTTIVADEKIMAEIEAIARAESVSVAHVIREGLRLRIEKERRIPSFIGAGSSQGRTVPSAREAGDYDFEPPAWR